MFYEGECVIIKFRLHHQKLQKSAKGKKYADAETYESLVIYNLQVKDQVEGGIAFFTDETHLTIQIKDINDNAPVFDTNGKFTYKINEDTQVGQPISKVNFDGTTDADVTKENRYDLELLLFRIC